jgi:hypothetical protein
VLLDEVLEWLAIKPEGVYVDATTGAAGHSAAIAARLASGRLISLDRDAQALQIARERLKEFGSRVSFVHAPFSRIAEAVQGLGIAMVDGVLADLGVSSMQLDRPERGFSFREGGPLDMRMSSGQLEEDTLTAEEIVNRWSEKELADLLYREAEEASRNKNVSGAADSGESRVGGTRAVSFSDSCHIKFRGPVGGADIPLEGRPASEARVPGRAKSGNAEGADETCGCAERGRAGSKPEIAKREAPVRGEGVRWYARARRSRR